MDVLYLPGVKPLLHSFIHGGKDGVPVVELFFKWLEGKKLDWNERMKLWPYISAWTVVKRVLQIDDEKVNEIISRRREIINAAKNVITSVLEFGIQNYVVLKAPLVVYYEFADKSELQEDRDIIRQMWDSGVCMLEFVMSDTAVGDSYALKLVDCAKDMGYGVALWIKEHVDVRRLSEYLLHGVRSVEVSVKNIGESSSYLRLLHDKLDKPFHVKLSVVHGAVGSLRESLWWLFSEVGTASVELVSDVSDWTQEEIDWLFSVYREFVGKGYYLVADTLLPRDYIGSLAEINTRFVRLSGSIGKRIWEYLGCTGEGRVWVYVDRRRRLYLSFDRKLSIGSLRGRNISELWYNHKSYAVEGVEAPFPSNPGSRFTHGGEESPSSIGQGAG